MKRLNRKEEAVSPVIATILMVAITVVLAATLYMMVGDIGGDGVDPITASISIEDYEWDDTEEELDIELEIDTLATPSSAELDDLDIRVIYEADSGTNGQISEEDITADSEDDWTGLTGDNEVTGGSTFYGSVNLDDLDDEGDLESIELRIDGYDGVESDDF